MTIYYLDEPLTLYERPGVKADLIAVASSFFTLRPESSERDSKFIKEYYDLCKKSIVPGVRIADDGLRAWICDFGNRMPPLGYELGHDSENHLSVNLERFGDNGEVYRIEAHFSEKNYRIDSAVIDVFVKLFGRTSNSESKVLRHTKDGTMICDEVK